MELDPVYRLEEDNERVAAVQRATLQTREYGLAPDPSLFGSPEWWKAIDLGRLPRRRREGTVTRVYWASTGDYSEFEVTEDTGETTTWHREGDVTLYVEGLHVRVTTVVQQPRRADTPAHEVILEVLLERSNVRSSPFGPGPFAREGATELFRPVGEAEAVLIVDAPNRFPPRLPHQPIFYPVTNFEYACQIARDWNTKYAASGFAGYVTRFYVNTKFLSQYDVHQVGGPTHTEYWIPSDDLEQFNENIVGPVEFVAEFHGGADAPRPAQAIWRRARPLVERLPLPSAQS